MYFYYHVKEEGSSFGRIGAAQGYPYWLKVVKIAKIAKMRVRQDYFWKLLKNHKRRLVFVSTPPKKTKTNQNLQIWGLLHFLDPKITPK